MRGHLMGLLMIAVAALGGCQSGGVQVNSLEGPPIWDTFVSRDDRRVPEWGETHIMRAGLGEEALVVRDGAEASGRYLLDTGDKLRVFVYGQPNLSRIYTVDPAGRIDVPLIGEVKARGHTTRELAGHIRGRLGSQFVRDPQVTVDVQQNRPFFILGEVKNAGQYPYVSGISVETAVAIAGGYSDRANERRARITRRVDGVSEVTEVPSDTVLQPGDTVYVAERWF